MTLNRSSLTAFLLLLVLPSTQALADEDWCYLDGLDPPCDGSPGRCTINSDGSYGGFVADTATVETTSFFGFFTRNIPYLGIHVQVCEEARVKEESTLKDFVQVRNRAEISGLAVLSERAMILDDAHIFGSAQVSGWAKVGGTSQIFGDTRIFGTSEIFGSSIFMHGWFASVKMGVSELLSHPPFEVPESDRTPFHLSERGIEIYFGGGESQEIREIAQHCLAKLTQAQQELERDEPERKELAERAQVLQAELTEVQNRLFLLEQKHEKCGICRELFHLKKDLILTSCQHLFCRECFGRLARLRSGGKSCPYCRATCFDEETLDVTYSAGSN